MRSLVLVLLFPMTSLAAPTEITHQGRLFDGLAQPLDGQHSLGFALFDAPSGGTAAWSETQDVDFDDGYFSARLGTSNALDSDDLSGDVMYLELTVDAGAPLANRVAVTSVPYALRAGSVSGGTVDATELQINGTTVIDSSGTLAAAALPSGADSDTLADLVCSNGDVAQLQAGSWACATIAVGTHSHDASDVTGVLDIGQIPVGTGSSQVSAGDHTHDASDVTGILAVAQIPVGTGSNQVAAGDHSHTAADVGALPISGGTLSGPLAVGDTSSSCTNGNDGTLRYGSAGLELCIGGGWTGIALNRKGLSQLNPGLDCADILAFDSSSATGVYWLDPANTATPFQAVCDMTSSGGGWTRLVPEFKSYSWRSANCGGSPDADCVPNSGVSGHTPHQYFGASTAGVVTYLDANDNPIPTAQLTALAGRVSTVTANHETWLYDPDTANPWPIRFDYADGSSAVVTPPGQFCNNCWRDDTATYSSHIQNAGIFTGMLPQQDNLGVFVHYLDGEAWVR